MLKRQALTAILATALVNTLAAVGYVEVTGRLVFYNRSAWDGNDPAANANDDNAIAPDKTALLPGGTATFANYTSYSRGLNGIMVDIANLPGTPTASDFTFKVGNDNTPALWSAAPAPASITVRAGAGTGGSDRVTLIWNDNNLDGVVDANEAVANQWLQVTVKATANTGLAGRRCLLLRQCCRGRQRGQYKHGVSCDCGGCASSHEQSHRPGHGWIEQRQRL